MEGLRVLGLLSRGKKGPQNKTLGVFGSSRSPTLTLLREVYSGSMSFEISGDGEGKDPVSRRGRVGLTTGLRGLRCLGGHLVSVYHLVLLTGADR